VVTSGRRLRLTGCFRLSNDMSELPGSTTCSIFPLSAALPADPLKAFRVGYWMPARVRGGVVCRLSTHYLAEKLTDQVGGFEKARLSASSRARFAHRTIPLGVLLGFTTILA
jgi:hypothetical protein